MYTTNDILFPHKSIAALRDVRGPRWRTLVERVVTLPETHEETLAFMLLMIRLNGCLSCETDSYRAMRGCTSCSQQVLRRCKQSDDELLAEYAATLDEVRVFAARRPSMEVVAEPVVS